MRQVRLGWGWTSLTLCQRQGKGGGRLAGRTWGGSSSSCSKGGGGGRSTGDWAFRHYYAKKKKHTQNGLMAY